jgi:glyoxylase-like metal-dependent hydrolase (beta-lactamase superfamily II)
MADSTPRFTEVAPRVWVAHYDWMHVNITLVGGSDGLLMVDTHGSAAEARRVADDVRRLGAGPLTGLVNTHEHWDHHFGNATMVEQFGDLPIHATEWAAAHMEVSARHTFERYEQDTEDPRGDEVLATTLHLPTHTFSSAVQLDLGDRAVELIHPGRGHTAGDLVVRVPDADVLLGGDLGVVAETIRDLASRGVPQSDALAQGEWPWDPTLLESAVRLGYEHLPRSQKRLPLV